MRRFLFLLLLICSPFCLETHAEKVRADSLVKLGNDYYHAGRFIDALDVMAEALEAADAEGNHQAYLKTLLLIGNTYTLFADYDQALHYYEQCEQKAAALHDEQIAMKARNNMLKADDETPLEGTAADAAEPLPDDNLLTKQQADELLMDIAHVMEDSVTVCNPDFSLSQLARMVSSNTKYVSWVINKTYGKNFKTYLTEYRIREASRLLADGGVSASLTIAAIAEQVGYKSPTAFNQAFRRIYGMTPSAYLKVVKREQSED